MSEISSAAAAEFLKANLAPWIQDLAITIERIDAAGAVLRVPSSPRLNRNGGTICGQAIMALADTAMIFAIAGCLGEFRPMTTVNQTAAFLRPAANADLVAEAAIIKPGRTIMYGEVKLFADDATRPVSHVTSTYMLL
ncbi:MAG: PaaI family thioesterase [Proteobacteria bacterium]|nr:PaaI family thioesterase [Pseudomonadota bacterium]